jgi:thiol-disulfide isomerase/thioredoxin
MGLVLAFCVTTVDSFCHSTFDPTATKVKVLSTKDSIEENELLDSNKGLIGELSGGLKARVTKRQRRFCIPEEIVTITDYKEKVVDEKDQMVVVRFYAPWCRACKAAQQPYRRLSRAFSGQRIKFVECPVTESNAFLHEGLGVPSLPFGHIYHPEAGLVEELSINKKVFKDFERVLKYYVNGQGEVEYKDDEPCTPVNNKK